MCHVVKPWDIGQWNHELYVSNKENSFTELNTTIPKGVSVYSNFAHKILAHVYDVLHIHKTFSVCPVSYNYVDHDMGTSVETVTDWAAAIGHTLQLARSRNQELEGWFMLRAQIKNWPVCFSLLYVLLLPNALASMMPRNGGCLVTKTCRTRNTY